MGELNLGALLSDDALVLNEVPSARYPDGKTYRVPSLSGGDVLKLKQLQFDQLDAAMDQVKEADGDISKLELSKVITPQMVNALVEFCGTKEDGKARSWEEKLLGTAYAEMIADEVSNNRIEVIAGIVKTAFTSGEAVAALEVEQAGKAVTRPNRAEKRQAARAPRKPAAKAGAKSSRASGRTPRRASPQTATPETGASLTPRKRSPAKAATR